ncbi:hypothetical protein OKW42_008129 [Paraburkholderia sp. WC7.3d]
MQWLRIHLFRTASAQKHVERNDNFQMDAITAVDHSIAEGAATIMVTATAPVKKMPAMTGAVLTALRRLDAQNRVGESPRCVNRRALPSEPTEPGSAAPHS